MSKILECIEYDKDSGKILCHYFITEDVFEILKAQGKKLLEGNANEETQYVDITVTPPQVVMRPTQLTLQDKTEIQADGVDVMTLSSLPPSCTVTIGSARWHVPDGILEWGTPYAGRYDILVEAFPFLEWRGEVRVA